MYLYLMREYCGKRENLLSAEDSRGFFPPPPPPPISSLSPSTSPPPNSLLLLVLDEEQGLVENEFVQPSLQKRSDTIGS